MPVLVWPPPQCSTQARHDGGLCGGPSPRRGSGASQHLNSMRWSSTQCDTRPPLTHSTHRGPAPHIRETSLAARGDVHLTGAEPHLEEAFPMLTCPRIQRQGSKLFHFSRVGRLVSAADHQDAPALVVRPSHASISNATNAPDVPPASSPTSRVRITEWSRRKRCSSPGR